MDQNSENEDYKTARDVTLKANATLDAMAAKIFCRLSIEEIIDYKIAKPTCQLMPRYLRQISKGMTDLISKEEEKRKS